MKLEDSNYPNLQKRKRILIVEDDETFTTLIWEILREHGDYEILTAEDGEKGLGLAREEKGYMDLVITDCMHPKLNGIEMASAIKQEFPRIPIIMFSGNYGVIKSQIPEGVFFEVRPKPFKVEEFLRIVDAALPSSEET